MSEEKLYAVKNDEGEWADAHYNFGSYAWVTPDKTSREEYVKHHGGHVITFVEEPKKVALTKEQAEIVEKARVSDFPGSYISSRLLMNAYVNGYTVENEKKYNLILGTETDGDTNALVKNNPRTDAVLWLNTNAYANDLKLDKLYQFTQEEIDKYNQDFWIKGIDLNDYKVEVKDDEEV